MEIRQLAINDYDKMTQLWARANLEFKPKARDSREAIATQMAVHPDFFLGAFGNNHLIGIVILSSDMRKGWINRLAVDPANKRSGVAKALIAESEKILRASNVRIFCALIERDNKPSQNLFEDCGYARHDDILYFAKRDSDDV